MNPLVGAQFLDYMEDHMDTSSTVDLDDIEDHIDITDEIESTVDLDDIKSSYPKKQYGGTNTGGESKVPQRY